MAGPKIPDGAQKRKRIKKKKSRTEVSSSDSESEVEQKKSRKSDVATTEPSVIAEEVEAPKKRTKKEKKLSKSSSKRTSVPIEANNGEDVSMIDTTPDSPASASPPAPSKAQESRQEQEQKFSTIYMKKITAELADDLDKVREAQDFTSRSLPMLIHALKQGESLFSMEEKRRVVGAVN